MNDQEIIEELVEVVKAFLDCPRWVDEATVPKAGIEAAPQQVVFNASISLMKIRRAQAIIGELEVAG